MIYNSLLILFSIALIDLVFVKLIIGILVYFLISFLLSILFLFFVFKTSKSKRTLYLSNAKMFYIAELIQPNSSLMTKIFIDFTNFIKSIFKPSKANGEKAPPAPSIKTGDLLDNILSF